MKKFALGLVIAAVVGGIALVAQAPLNVIKADFVETDFNPGQDATPVVQSEGTIYNAPSGRQRIERTARGVTTVEIIDAANNEHIILDPQAKTVRVGTLRVPMIPNVKIVPSGKPSTPRENQNSRDLGRKQVGPLTLHGQAVVGPHPSDVGTLSAEFWGLEIPGQPMPILMERRIAGVEVQDQHLVNVTTIQAPPSFFEIPAGFTQVQE
jgi:hypothetical protein